MPDDTTCTVMLSLHDVVGTSVAVWVLVENVKVVTEPDSVIALSLQVVSMGTTTVSLSVQVVSGS